MNGNNVLLNAFFEFALRDRESVVLVISSKIPRIIC